MANARDLIQPGPPRSDNGGEPPNGWSAYANLAWPPSGLADGSPSLADGSPDLPLPPYPLGDYGGLDAFAPTIDQLGGGDDSARLGLGDENAAILSMLLRPQGSASQSPAVQNGPDTDLIAALRSVGRDDPSGDQPSASPPPPSVSDPGSALAANPSGVDWRQIFAASDGPTGASTPSADVQLPTPSALTPALQPVPPTVAAEGAGVHPLVSPQAGDLTNVLPDPLTRFTPFDDGPHRFPGSAATDYRDALSSAQLAKFAADPAAAAVLGGRQPLTPGDPLAPPPIFTPSMRLSPASPRTTSTLSPPGSVRRSPRYTI